MEAMKRVRRLTGCFLRERLTATWKEGWEPAIVCWAEDETIPSHVLAKLASAPRARSKKAKAR